MDTHLKSHLANLHDAFLNACLQQYQMQKEPIALDPQTFMISDRGRFERTWLAFLYVLVECWQSKQMKAVRDFISSHVSDSQIDQLLREGKQKGLLDDLREVRNYMCHRDKRAYWDLGRLAVAHSLSFNTTLYNEFGRVLHVAMRIHSEAEKVS